MDFVVFVVWLVEVVGVLLGFWMAAFAAEGEVVVDINLAHAIINLKYALILFGNKFITPYQQHIRL